MAVKLVFVHALSSLHAGTGQGAGTIDLPIARERATDLPLIPGSSIKGCLKDVFRNSPDKDTAFGTPDAAGLLQVSDARLLLLPIRCLGASFMWTTSPYVLRRLRRDADAAKAGDGIPDVPALEKDTARVATIDALIKLGDKQQLILEDLNFEASATQADEWAEWIAERLFFGDKAWQKEFKKRFAIVDDENFKHLYCQATEVNAHVEIDHGTGIVNNLWYQESLPAETVLVALFRGEERNERNANALLTSASQVTLQLGGNATTGQGLVRLVAAGGTA